MIGGLAQETDLKRHTKLPFIGELPVHSLFFTTENSTRSKTDLYVVITPQVIRGRSVGVPALPPPEH